MSPGKFFLLLYVILELCQWVTRTRRTSVARADEAKP